MKRLWFFVGLLPAIIIYSSFAEWSWGSLTDHRLWLWFHLDGGGAALHPGQGPFSLHNLPWNIYTAMFMAPATDGRPPYIHPTIAGQAVWSITPALVLALRAPLNRPTLCLWGMAICSMIPSMTVYANGSAQLGFRYLILAYPFLFVLMARGWQRDALSYTLVIASIMLTWFFISQMRGWM